MNKQNTNKPAEAGSTKDGAGFDVVSTNIILVKTMIRTTASIFLPPILFLALGFFADRIFATKPTIMIIGAIFGLATSAILIWLQLRSIRNGAES